MQCVCITDVWTCVSRPGMAPGIAKGDVLTISEVETIEGEPYLTFRETSATRCYYAGGFRPLVKRTQEQDVAKFAHLLNPIHIEERV